MSPRCSGVSRGDEITRDLILSHLAECGRRLSRFSADRHKNALKSYFEFIEFDSGLWNPMRGMLFRRAGYHPIPRVISAEQIAAMIDAEPSLESRGTHVRRHRALELRDRALLEVADATGCRISELISLNWQDLHGGMPGDVRITAGKGGDDRIALNGERARDALAKWRRAAWVTDLGAPIFQNLRGERLTVRAAEMMFKARGERAGVEEPVHPHMFRHSCATHLLERGAGIADIGALLGHKNLNSTARYTHVNMAYLRGQHAAAFPRS